MFRGIPRHQSRGPRNFFASLAIHIVGIGALVLAAPQILLQSGASRFNATLIAPPEERPLPKPAPIRPRVEPPPAPLRPLRELPRPAEAKIALPKVEEAPVLKNTPKPEVVLPPPVQAAAIRPPVQTGVFGSTLPAQADPKLPLPAARNAGFDQAANLGPAVPQPPAAVSAGFDTHSTESRAVTANTRIRTGAFEAASVGESRTSRLVAANVSHTAFDARAETDRPAVSAPAVRKADFDEEKAVNAPAKPTAPAAAAVRPVEILEKPKPAYTAEARLQRVEGTVVLDVIFTASGEVRVLGVKRGLGHGLDENAVDAARHIRFVPATQAGAPVDQHVFLQVVFQITG